MLLSVAWKNKLEFYSLWANTPTLGAFPLAHNPRRENPAACGGEIYLFLILAQCRYAQRDQQYTAEISDPVQICVHPFICMVVPYSQQQV